MKLPKTHINYTSSQITDDTIFFMKLGADTEGMALTGVNAQETKVLSAAAVMLAKVTGESGIGLQVILNCVYAKAYQRGLKDAALTSIVSSTEEVEQDVNFALNKLLGEKA